MRGDPECCVIHDLAAIIHQPGYFAINRQPSYLMEL